MKTEVSLVWIWNSCKGIVQNLSLSLLKIQSRLPYKRAVCGFNLPHLGTARISIVEEGGSPHDQALRQSGALWGFKCWSWMQRFLRRAKVHNSLYRLILGISHREQPEKLKLELCEKIRSLPPKNVCINLKVWSCSLVEQTPLNFISGLTLFLIQLWKECLAFFLCSHQKSPQNLDYCFPYFRLYLQWQPIKIFYQMA